MPARTLTTDIVETEIIKPGLTDETTMRRDPSEHAPLPADETIESRDDGTGTPLHIDTVAVLRKAFFSDALDAHFDPIDRTGGGFVPAFGNYEIMEDTAGPTDIVADCDYGYLTIGGTIVGTGGDDVIDGSECDDVILDHGAEENWTVDHDMIFGHGGDDLIIGGFGNDTFEGGAGDDALYGGFGDDELNGGAGFDQLFGGGGNDTLRSGDGVANLLGEDGNDILVGGDGYDWVQGGAHDDYIDGGAGNDRLWGDGGVSQPVGDDTIFGGAGEDFLDGGSGDDVLDGGDDKDTIEGGHGNDILFGGAGNDLLFDGGEYTTTALGDDILDGGAGNDGLIASGGTNILTGGSGADHFIVDLGAVHGDPFEMPADLNFNTITDYRAAEGDVVQGFTASQVGSSTHVFSGTNELLFVLLDTDIVADGITMIW